MIKNMDLKGNVFTFKIKKRFQFIWENKFHLKRGGISSREKAEKLSDAKNFLKTATRLYSQQQFLLNSFPQFLI